MAEIVIRRRFIGLMIMSALVMLAWWPDLGSARFSFFPDSLCGTKELCVVFLDVGQGDSIFIQSPSGQQMLMDTGKGQSVLRGLGDVMSLNDREIDYVLTTHPDADHIGGLSEVLERFEVNNLIMTENESDTPIWQLAKRAVLNENAKVIMARRGQLIDLGAGVQLEILFPDIDPTELESNTSSIVARLTYGERSFLLTGDSPKAIEEYLVLIEGANLESDVLKVGHHGSRTSTSLMFLAEVSPKYAVISAGKNNSYGHPHVEVTDALFNAGVEILNTAEVGHVVFWSDGHSLELR